MSIRQMAIVWQHSKQAGTALIVMLKIADHATDAGLAYPGVGRLARAARIKERQLQQIVRQLVAERELEVYERASPPLRTSGGLQRTNVYRILCGGQEGGAVDFTTLEVRREQVVQASAQGGAGQRHQGGAVASAPEPSVTDKPPGKETTLAPAQSRAGATVSFAATGFDVPAEIVQAWKAAYPAVEVEAEVLRAHAWAVANPAQRKANWARFLVNWLAKAQERGGGRRGRGVGSVDGLTVEQRRQRILRDLRGGEGERH